MKKNIYDEILEYTIYLMNTLEHESIEFTKRKIHRATNVIKRENSILRNINNPSKEEYEEIIKSKSSFDIKEHYASKQFAELILKVTNNKISTFADKLKILDVSEKIKKYIKNDYERVRAISLSEIILLDRMANDNEKLIDEAIEWLENNEKITKRRPKIKEFEKWLTKKSNYKKKNRGYKKIRKPDSIKERENNTSINFNNCTFIFN
ncbi:hypothetical protein [Halarcobacter anaerophilus]|uniref:Uncharacterized protein n=1 Tax=Halarcobacter anaerophilus TaxID=877500 RepID=A0A4Q0Y2K5_9BACT|nr:hypothetical protein [Halarcobacter anaerophilus]QDF29937.1 hypothetical protein AANAER_2481 [Halarcobacter anaerophilus]RXJ62899.1 hypothetical protein CRV06_08675 [Halarcobacter anaerophilus]